MDAITTKINIIRRIKSIMFRHEMEGLFDNLSFINLSFMDDEMTILIFLQPTKQNVVLVRPERPFG